MWQTWVGKLETQDRWLGQVLLDRKTEEDMQKSEHERWKLVDGER